jgi:N-methylhydantoinase A/oxoprolinase/acetone carboxylase beta subunit
MEAEGHRILGEAGVSPDQVNVSRTADMRLYGQAHQISVPIPGGPLSTASFSEINQAFETAYVALYKRTTPGVRVEAISWRVVVSGPTPNLSLSHDVRPGGAAKAAVKGERAAYFPETGFTPTPVYDRYALVPGQRLSGPAIVEERESTVVVGPDAWVEIDVHANLLMALP